MLPADHLISKIVHEFLVGCCVEIISRDGDDLRGFNEAMLLLASFDKGPFGDASRKQLSELAKSLAVQIIKSAPPTFVVAKEMIPMGAPITLRNAMPIAGADALRGYGAGFFGIQRWGKA